MGRTEILHHPGEEEAGQAEHDDAGQIVGRSVCLCDAQFLHHQADGERPHTYLCSDVEELCHDAPRVATVLEQPCERSSHTALSIVLSCWHPREYHHGHNRNEHETKPHIGLGDAEERDVPEDELLAEQDAHDAADGVERLRDVQPSRCRFRRTHREDVGISCCLKHGATASQDVYGNEVEQVALRQSSRVEQHGTAGIEQKAKDDACLERKTSDEERCR